MDSKGFNWQGAHVASGESFPDALTGSVAAAANGSPIVLVPQSPYGSNTAHNYAAAHALVANRASLAKITLLGGTPTIPQLVRNYLINWIWPETKGALEDGYYILKNALNPALVLGIQNASLGDASLELQYYSANALSQVFRVRNLGDGSASVIAMHSGYALDVPQGIYYDGRQLAQLPANQGSSSQGWHLTHTDGDTVRISTALGDGTWAISAQNSLAQSGVAAVLSPPTNGNTPAALGQRFLVQKLEQPLGYGTYERLNGIDVSSWQPANIGDLVSYDFMIVKATQGTWYTNPNFSQQANSAFWSGKKLGVYHFAEYGTSPQAEAQFFVSHVQGYLGNAILILDYEAESLNNGREWVRAFMREVKRLTGITCGLYCSTSYINAQNLSGLCKEEGALLWNANYWFSYQPFYAYDQNITPGVPCEIYQYTSSGRLPGYDGNLDLNVFYGTRSDWDWYATH